MEEDRLTAIARRNRNQVVWLSLLGAAACAAAILVDGPRAYYVAGLVGSVGGLGYALKTRVK